MGLNYNPTIVPDGLVMYMDITNPRSYSGSGNTVYNLVNGGIAGTIVTGITYDTDKRKNLNFNGSSGYMISNDTSLNFATNDFTIQTTLKLNGLSNSFNGVYNSKICAGSDANSSIFQFSGTASSYYQIGIYNEPTGIFDGVNYSFLTNKVYNLTVTKNTSLIEFFVDGVSIGATTSTKSYNFTGGGFAIGRWFFSGYEAYLKGSIYEFKAYNRALSASEIKQNYDASKGRFLTPENIVTSGLILNFDSSKANSYSGFGNTIYDLSGFGNTGTLTNGPTFSGLNSGEIVFDGSNDYINVSNGFTNLFKSKDYWSVGLWVKLLSQTAGEPVLISAGPSIGYYDLFLEVANNAIYFAAGRGSNTGYIQNTNVSGTLGYNLTTNYFNIVFVKDGSTTGYVYVNSINIPMSVVGLGLSSMPNINEDMRIGTFKQSGFELHGNIAQVQMYNRALSAAEILQNYNATKSRFGL